MVLPLRLAEVINKGANGYNLYYQTALIDSTAQIDFNGGQLIHVPEPCSFLLVALTDLGLMNLRL
jgi:hypothetical protein